MTTLEILLSSAKKEATIRVWGIAQRAINRIGIAGLIEVQAQLRKTNPNFFIPKSLR